MVDLYLCGQFSPSQELTVGVLNSILRCVRLVSGAVSASLGSVSPIICLPSFVSHVLCQGLCPPPWALCLPSVPKQFTVGVLNSLSSGVRLCSDGGVWLSGCPEFICPLVAIHLSPNLAGGVQLSGCLQFICLPLSQLICFPVWLVVSRSLAVSNSFVCPYINSFVSQSGWWCPALWLSPIHLSALISTHLFPSLAGGVRLFGCLQFICLPLWQLICLPIWLVVSGFGCLQFICLALWQHICLPVWLVVSGSSAVSVTLVMSGSLAVSNSFVSKSGWWRLCLPNDSFVSQSGWWCPAFRLAPIHLSPLVTLHLSPSLAGGVRLSGCLQFICFRLVAIHLSPSLAGGVRLSMLSAVSNSFVFPCGN